MKNDDWKKICDEAYRIANTNLDSKPSPAGEMKVVLGPGWPAILIHEAVGHGLEGDFNRKKTSVFHDLVGKKVGVEMPVREPSQTVNCFLITLASGTGSNATPWGITTRQPLLVTNSSTPSGSLPPFRVVGSSWRHRPMTSV